MENSGLSAAQLLEASGNYKVMVIIDGIKIVKMALDTKDARWAIRPLRDLILVLQEESQQKLKENLKRLREIEFSHISGKEEMDSWNERVEIEDIFAGICSYLFETYLKDIGWHGIKDEDFERLEKDQE